MALCSAIPGGQASKTDFEVGVTWTVLVVPSALDQKDPASPGDTAHTASVDALFFANPGGRASTTLFYHLRLRKLEKLLPGALQDVVFPRNLAHTLSWEKTSQTISSTCSAVRGAGASKICSKSAVRVLHTPTHFVARLGPLSRYGHSGRRGHLNDIWIGLQRPTHHYMRQQTKPLVLKPKMARVKMARDFTQSE